MTHSYIRPNLKAALLAGGALMLPGAALAQELPQNSLPESSDQIDEQLSEEVPANAIVVTGFRESLNAAIAAKRASASQVDVIVAEDIAKFPDTNLAESLQRVPGIAIQRDAGEGRNIVVRGLGAQFTRVRVNGMEAAASSSSDSGGGGTGRSFDFNVFASELFSSIVVHKTAQASLDEGSLGAVVDLNTGNPLAYDPGFSLVGSAQVRYNDLNDDAGPRLAGLLSWTNPDQTFGASVSAAYSQYVTSELGNNTVRWQQAAFGSVEGTPCYSGGTYVPSGACNEAGLAFHPRIPRYGLFEHDRERLGLTGSVQWAPSERTKISIDGLYSSFSGDRSEIFAEVLFRGNERLIDVVDYSVDENNNMVTGTFDNAWVRTENYLREGKTEFYQYSGRLEQELTDTLALNVLAGKSKSEANRSRETTLIFDDRDFDGYSFDYTDMYSPVLTFAGGLDDPAQFQLAEFRDRPALVTNEYETLSGNLVWEATEGASIEAGALYRKFTYDVESFTRDSTYCAAFTCAAGQYGLPVTANIAELFELGDAGQPDGTTSSWIIPNIEAAADAVNLYGRDAIPDLGNTSSVTEEVTGGYFQANWDTYALGFRFTGNFGTRYVHTDQSSTGFQGSTEVTVERSYDDWLPALNANFFVTDDFVVRGAVSKVITRPSLGTLSPGGSIDQFNFGLSSGNPFLDPYRATAYDVALEWYFAPGALASVAAFAKDIESFPISQTLTGTFESFADFGFTTVQLTAGTPVYNALVLGQNPTALFNFNTSVNGSGANLKGVELSLQLPFSVFADGFLSNFGILGNATFIDSDVDYTIALPGTVLNTGGNPSFSAGEATTAIYTRPLIDLAKRAFNGTLYYEDDAFSARVSAAWRDSYIDGVSGNRNIFEGFDSTLNVDASIRYRISEMLEISLEGTNLTDEYRERWVNDPSQRNYENNHFGRVIMAGVRFQL